MRIAHIVGRSLVRFTPGRIATYWGRYTEHEGRAFSTRRTVGYSFQEPLNPSGFYCARERPKAPIVDWLEASDVIHCHDDAYPTLVAERYGVDFSGKTLVYHAHIGSIPMRYFGLGRNGAFSWSSRVKHVAITNGYGHIFDDHEKRTRGACKWGRLPDILDLDHPTYAPDPSLRDWDAERLEVCYTYSNHHESGRINSKRPRAHKRILAGVPGITATVIYGRPFEESMALKKASHVVLDECFSNYLHLSALEGAAVGAAVVTKFDEHTMVETSRAVGAPTVEWPFYYADEKTLPEVLAELRDDREKCREIGARCRRWMEKYYTAPRLLGKYLELYER